MSRSIHPDYEALRATQVRAQESDRVSAYTGCRAARDGDCYWAACPQTRDAEPKATGRHCPLDCEDEEL